MRFSISLMLAMALTPIIGLQDSRAQDAPIYVVSYIEVAPTAGGPTAGLLRQLATSSRKDDGNMRFDVLQRVAPPNQLAIVAIWKDQKSYDAHAAAPHTKEFRDKIKPHLISAIDDRLHNEVHRENLASFGFFEADDEESARALFAAVEAWATSRGRTPTAATRPRAAPTRTPPPPTLSPKTPRIPGENRQPKPLVEPHGQLDLGSSQVSAGHPELHDLQRSLRNEPSVDKVLELRLRWSSPR